jgi:hypothetical protein
VDEMALHNFIFTHAKLYYYTYTNVNKKFTDPNWYIKKSLTQRGTFPSLTLNKSINHKH